MDKFEKKLESISLPIKEWQHFTGSSTGFSKNLLNRKMFKLV